MVCHLSYLRGWNLHSISELDFDVLFVRLLLTPWAEHLSNSQNNLALARDTIRIEVPLTMTDHGLFCEGYLLRDISYFSYLLVRKRRGSDARGYLLSPHSLTGSSLLLLISLADQISKMGMACSPWDNHYINHACRIIFGQWITWPPQSTHVVSSRFWSGLEPSWRYFTPADPSGNNSNHPLRFKWRIHMKSRINPGNRGV